MAIAGFRGQVLGDRCSDEHDDYESAVCVRKESLGFKGGGRFVM